MTKIKFRAWNNIVNKFVDFNLVGNNIDGYGGIDKNTGINIELCMYSGVQDCNGKDIYEGDILQISNCTYIVKYGIEDIIDNEGYSSNTVCGFYLYVNDKDTYMERHFDVDEMKIIGNIYENKDLIYNKKQMMYSI